MRGRAPAAYAPGTGPRRCSHRAALPQGPPTPHSTAHLKHPLRRAPAAQAQHGVSEAAACEGHGVWVAVRGMGAVRSEQGARPLPASPSPPLPPRCRLTGGGHGGLVFKPRLLKRGKRVGGQHLGPLVRVVAGRWDGRVGWESGRPTRASESARTRMAMCGSARPQTTAPRRTQPPPGSPRRVPARKDVGEGAEEAVLWQRRHHRGALCHRLVPLKHRLALREGCRVGGEQGRDAGWVGGKAQGAVSRCQARHGTEAPQYAGPRRSCAGLRTWPGVKRA